MPAKMGEGPSYLHPGQAQLETTGGAPISKSVVFVPQGGVCSLAAVSAVMLPPAPVVVKKTATLPGLTDEQGACISGWSR